MTAPNYQTRWRAVVDALGMDPDETLAGVVEEIWIYRARSNRLDEITQLANRPVEQGWGDQT